MKDLEPLPTVVCRMSVNEAKVLDTGLWTCELSNSAGKTASTCNVKVIDVVGESKDTPPCFEESLNNVTATKFTDAVFRCKAVGNPPPDVKWFRNDVPVDPSFRHDIKLDDEGFQTLTVKNIEISDEGVYKVRVSNTAGWASCDAKLYITSSTEDSTPVTVTKQSEYSLVDTIKGRRADQNMLNEADTLLNVICDTDTIKKFLIKWKLNDQTLGFPVHLRNKCSVEGSQAVLSCLVNGFPPFSVRWYKDNNEIFDGSKYFIRGNLNILSLEMPLVDIEDTGQYMCIVRNDQGKIFTSCYLQVEPRLEGLSAEVPTKPFFTKPMKKQTVDEGELIIFRVTAKAHPSPGFKWFKDGMELHDNDRINTETLPHGVAQLSIHMATFRDTGLYVCEAHNHAGRARSMVRLRVRDKYEAMRDPARKSLNDIVVSTEGTAETTGHQNGDLKQKDPPYIPRIESEAFSRAPILDTALPKTVSVRDRGRFIIECCVTGFPKPKVTWSRNDQMVQEDDYVNFLSLGDWYGLEVVEALPRHEGVYTVRFQNSSGVVTSACKVEMKLPKEESKQFHTDEETLEGFFHKPKLHAVQTVFPWHQFDIPGITPSFHLCNFEVDRTELISTESICLVDTLESPHFVKPLPDMVSPYESDANLRLDCEVGGKPCPKVVWLKDDTSLPDSKNIITSWDPETRTASLTFATVGLDDSGKYSCVAYSDIGGHASTSSEVQVRGLDYPDKDKESAKRAHPEFKIRLEDKEAIPGEEVRLEVKAEGYPPPEVTWFKNSELITAAIDKYTITSSVEGLHTLIIPDIHLSDSDCFKCEARNDYGAVSTCAHVKVQEHSDSQNEASTRPHFEEPLHSISVTLGEDATFKCIAAGNPTPVFKWLKQGVTGIDQNRVQVEVSDGTTTLTLRSVDQHDAGLYYCFANNKDGTAKSCASLTVLGSNGSLTNPPKVDHHVGEGEKNGVTLFEENAFKEPKSSDERDKVNSDKSTEELNGTLKVLPASKEIIKDEERPEESSKELQSDNDKRDSSSTGPNTDSHASEDQKQEEDPTERSHQEPEPVNTKKNATDVSEEPKTSNDIKNHKNDSNEVVIEKHESEGSGKEKIESKVQVQLEKGSDVNSENDSKKQTLDDEVTQLQQASKFVVDGNVSQSETLLIDAQEASNVLIDDSAREKTCSDKTYEDPNNTALKPKTKPKSSDTIKNVAEDKLEKPGTAKKPKFVSHPRSKWVALSSPLELNFAAQKCENLKVAWYKDGVILKDENRF